MGVAIGLGSFRQGEGFNSVKPVYIFFDDLLLVDSEGPAVFNQGFDNLSPQPGAGVFCVNMFMGFVESFYCAFFEIFISEAIGQLEGMACVVEGCELVFAVVACYHFYQGFYVCLFDGFEVGVVAGDSFLKIQDEACIPRFYEWVGDCGGTLFPIGDDFRGNSFDVGDENIFVVFILSCELVGVEGAPFVGLMASSSDETES